MRINVEEANADDACMRINEEEANADDACVLACMSDKKPELKPGPPPCPVLQTAAADSEVPSPGII